MSESKLRLVLLTVFWSVSSTAGISVTGEQKKMAIRKEREGGGGEKFLHVFIQTICIIVVKWKQKYVKNRSDNDGL